MKKTLTAIAMSSTMFLIIARFTGRSQTFTTVTGKQAIHCQYQIPGRTFWMDFMGFNCPQTVEVQ